MEINLEILARDRDGVVVDCHRGHNIWVQRGCTYLRDLIHYATIDPTLTTTEDRRVRYMGFGIGSYLQDQPSIADNPPMSTDYPGTHIQTDYDMSVVELERPIRHAAGLYLYELPPPTFEAPNKVKFTGVFDLLDISYGSYLAVPLSEIGLFLSDATPNADNNQLVAYDAYRAIVKTQTISIEVNWIVGF